MAKTLRNLMGAGIGAQAASLLNGIVADNLTATGSAQGDALTLTGDVNVLSVVPVASGVRLPALPQPGDETLIANLGANTLTVYPPPGATIEGGPTNAPFSLPSGASAEFIARVGSSNWIALSSGGTVAGTPVNSVLPKFVDGLGNTVTAPVVGQPLFIDVGTWNNSPTSLAYQVYDDTGAILDAYGTVSASGEQAYIVYDTEVGHPLHVGVVASNGLSSIEASSTATSNVADRTIAKPTLTRTSSSGVTPMTFSIVLPSGAWAGDQVRFRSYSNATLGDDVKLQDVYYALSEADLQTPFTPDLSGTMPAAFSNPGATDYLTVTIYGRTPQGRDVVSLTSDAISPTDAVTAVAFDPANKSAGATLSNSNLTAALTGGGVQYARSTRGVSGKSYAEFKVDALSGTVGIGVSDPTEGSLTTNWAGDVDSLGVSITSDGADHFGAGNGVSPSFAVNDIIGIHTDKPNGKVYFKKNNVNILGGDPAAGTGGLSISPTAALLWIVQSFGGSPTVTARYASADWTYSPAAGYGQTP